MGRLAGFLLLFLVPGSMMNPALGQVLLEQDFSMGEMPPEAWTLEGAESQWSVASSSNAGGEAPEAAFQWVQLLGTSRLIGPLTDLTGIDSLYLTFRHMYDDYQGDGPAVGVATRSGGGPWSTVWELSPEGNMGPEEITILITNDNTGEPDLQCCFYVTGNLFNLDYWYLDDIRLYKPVQLNVRMFLEGPSLGDQMMTQLNSQGFLPADQPFASYPWYYSGPETVDSIPPAVVDWVLVELWKRDLNLQPAFTRVLRQASFLLKNGSLAGLDGIHPLAVHADDPDSLYLWIHHRNHFSVMTSVPLGQFADQPWYDLSRHPAQSMHGKSVLKNMPGGKWVSPAGDGNADGQINMGDMVEVWAEQLGNTGYLAGDFNLDGIVNEADLVKYWQPNDGRMAGMPDTAVIPFICGDTLHDVRDGNEYPTVQVGMQCWMKENLRFEAGNSWCYYNDPAYCTNYGRLYDWYTIMNGTSGSNAIPSGVQGICPEGWHVPSDGEWCILTTFIDESVDCNTSGYNGTDCGYAMKSDGGWSSGGNGSDAYGFSALPSGCMGIYHFDDLYLFSYFWSATEDYPGFSLLIKLNYGLPKVGRYFSMKNRGYSLRCIKD